MTTSAVIWTLDKEKIILLSSITLLFIGAAAAFHADGISGYDTYSNYGSHYPSLDDPRQALTEFVAPFLLIALIFQRGYQRALTYTYADESNNPFDGYNKKSERKKVRKFSLIMSLATAGMIVPTPWFRIIRLWVANLFSLIGILFFGAIFVAFVWVIWKGLS